MSENREVNLGCLTHFAIGFMAFIVLVIASYLIDVRDDVRAIRQSVEEITLCIKDMKSEVDTLKQITTVTYE